MGMTTLCYIEKDNKYLMLHRIKKEHDINKDKWIGVGGHFEHGESPEDCMFREVMEETGLTPLSYRFCGIVTFLSDMGTEKEAWEKPFEEQHKVVEAIWSASLLHTSTEDIEKAAALSLDMSVEGMYSGLHADFAEAAWTGRPADWV